MANVMAHVSSALRFTLTAFVALFAPAESRADEPPQSSTAKTVMITGAAVFATGYLPVATPGLASAAGTYGRAVALLFTFGLPCTGRDDESDIDHPVERRSYLCNGTASASELLVPFAGPFLYARDHGHDSIVNPNGNALSTAEKDLLYTSGAMQMAGAALFLVGAVISAAEPETKSATSPQKRPRFSVLPAVTPTAIGVSVSAAAW